MKLVSESQTKVMKLASISLTIAAVLAAIAGSMTAAAAPRPFERDVDIYSRTNAPQEARLLNLHAGHLAKRMGLVKVGEKHEKLADSVEKGHEDPEISKAIALETIKAAHADAGVQSLRAARVAEARGLPILTQLHVGNAKQNFDCMLGNKQDPNFVERSNAASAHTLKNFGSIA